MSSAAAIASSFRHPRPRLRPGRPPPRTITVTIARYREQFEQRRGPLWDYFRDRTPALYDDQGGPGDRRRGLRTDGADSLLCVIVTLLSCMDVRRGFVGRPPADGEGRWHRRTVRELFGFAFGQAVPGALSIRRLERCLRALKSLGVLTTQQVRTKTARGFESLAAVRHVTDELFRLAGTARELARERREAFAAAARARRAQNSPRAAGIESAGPDVSGRGGTVVHGPAPSQPRTGPPQELRDLLGRLKLTKPRS